MLRRCAVAPREPYGSCGAYIILRLLADRVQQHFLFYYLLGVRQEDREMLRLHGLRAVVKRKLYRAYSLMPERNVSCILIDENYVGVSVESRS